MRRLPFLFLLLAGCHKDNPSPAPSLPQVSAKIEFATPQKQSLAWTIEQPGTVHAFEVTPVVAKLPGFVSKVYVDMGDRVTGPEYDQAGNLTKPGQLLVEVSVPEQALEAQQKRAMVELAVAEVEQAKSSSLIADEMIAASDAMVKVEQAGLLRVLADVDRWGSELKRVEGLNVGKVLDAQTLDESRKQFASAKATQAEAEAKIVSAQVAVRTAKARKSRAEADVAAAVAKRKVAEAEAEKAESLLEYTHIRAPFNGVVITQRPDTNRFVQPGAGGQPAALFTIARLDTVRIFVEVPEVSAIYATIGTPVTLRFPALNHREVTGAITRTSHVLSHESRTLKVEIDLPNPDGTLTPGLYCTVNFRASNKDAFVLPTAAILYADETAYCFILHDGKVTKMRVQVGHVAGTTIQVLRKRPASTIAGDWQLFDGTEKVAVGNLGALADGQVVEGK
jgi:RND family efflux transporter MFP subunit